MILAHPLMELPSHDAVKLYLSALDVSLRANASNMTRTQALIIKCSAVYAFSFWATACMPNTSASVRLVRAVLDEEDLAQCGRLLDHWGTHDGKLATINGAVFWCALVDRNVTGVSFTDPRHGQRLTCCLCRGTDCRPGSVSPALYLRQNKCVAVCNACSTLTERRVPLHESPTRQHCSACGRSLGGEEHVAAHGNDRVCGACDALVYSFDID